MSLTSVLLYFVLLLKKKNKKTGLGCSSVLEQLPSMCKAQGSNPNTTQTRFQTDNLYCWVDIYIYLYLLCLLISLGSVMPSYVIYLLCCSYFVSFFFYCCFLSWDRLSPSHSVFFCANLAILLSISSLLPVEVLHSP